jgi:hypothetical protein
VNGTEFPFGLFLESFFFYLSKGKFSTCELMKC